MGTSSIDNEILTIVRQIKSEADSANRSYEWEVDRIERKASYTTIDISQMNIALEIIAESKKALDELYTTYESLVRTLDMRCRPLADQGASASAVKEVYELIAYMNSESSSLSGNFTASLNSSSLGDVGGMRYIASLEAQTIEKTWKTRYSLMPEAIEEEKRRKKLAEEAAKRREEQRKKEQKAKEEKAKKDAEEAKRIEKANLEAKKHMDSIKKECDETVSKFEKTLKAELKKRKEDLKREIASKLAELEGEKKKHEEVLSTLGFFKMSEKKREKQEIVRIENRIFRFKDPTIISDETAKWEEVVKQAVNKYKKEVNDYLNKRFPTKKEKVVRKFSDDNEGIKLRILDVLDRKKCAMTITELMEADKYLGDIFNAKISALVRQLKESDYVIRSEAKGKAYFSISGSGENFLNGSTTVKPTEKYKEDNAMSQKPCPPPPSVESVFKGR